MANSGKIASSLWKMSMLGLLSLSVFFADQVVCFSVNHPNAESSQLRPEPNSLETPAGDAELPAPVSLPSHSSRARRDLTDCITEYKTLFDSRYSKFLSVFGNGTVRGVEPCSADENTNLRVVPHSSWPVLYIMSSLGGYLGVRDGAVIANLDKQDVNETLWCENGGRAGYWYSHLSSNVSACADTSDYLKVKRNGDLTLSNQLRRSAFVKL